MLGLKFFAWFLTHSVSILTDALESIVNVVAGFIGLYSLYFSAKPRDRDHPYGHGKAEFLSAAIEGSLILVAGFVIIYKVVEQLVYPVKLEKVDLGIWIVGATALINFVMGWFCLKIGKKNDSLALIASGRHLQSDTWSTIAIIMGLILIYFTGLRWIDSLLAIGVAVLIIRTAYNILRKSVAGIMDEADEKLLGKLVNILDKNRRENWIDIHNLRVIKYGSVLHVDCHLTVPWYQNVHEAHAEIDKLSGLVKELFDQSVELFVHSDGCLPFQCHICSKQNCRVRQQEFVRKITWTMENLSQNKKHQIN